MNPQKNAIIILKKDAKDWKDSTQDIRFAKPIKNDYGKLLWYEVEYQNGKEFKHSRDNLRWLREPKEIDSNKYTFYHDDVVLFGIISVLLFDDWVRFFFGDGSYRSYPVKEIKIVEIANSEPKVNNYLKYLHEVSKYIEGKDKILNEQLKELTIPKASVLFNVINNIKTDKFGIDENKLIFPFSYNKSQRQAIFHALNNNISLIQGPPGTGKTQTILNIVANLLYRNKTVAVVAGNNEATRNVEEKLEAADLGFLTAYIGKKDNVHEFFAKCHEIPECCERWKSLKIDKKAHEKHLAQLVGENGKSLSYQIQVAMLQQQIHDLQLEQSIFEAEIVIHEERVSPKIRKTIKHKHFTFERLLELKAKLEVLPEERLRKFFMRAYCLKNFGIFRTVKHLSNRDEILLYLTSKQYELHIKELQKELDEKTTFLNSMKGKRLDEIIATISMQLLQSRVSELYLNDFKLNNRNYKFYFPAFQKRFPVVFSTTHALATTSGTNYLYDCVIIDESSQVCLASAAIAMSRAKNLVLVGDLMQLPNVVTGRVKPDLEKIFKRYNFPHYLNYASNSILKSVAKQYANRIPNTLLNEHYRCDPEIIGFCNKRFYNDRLIIKTKHKPGNGVKVIYTDSTHARSHPDGGSINERQVDIITEEILPIIQSDDFGVVAPFNVQVDLLKSKLGMKNLIATVHKFQGKEKKNIILSSVVNNVKINENEEPDFMNDPKLLNVAISRAKDRLFLIVSEELMKQDGAILSDFSRYIKYYCEDGKVEGTTVYSIMDLMHKTYSPKLEEFRKKIVKVSEYESENIMNALIKEICDERRYGLLGFHRNYSLRYVVKPELIVDEEDKKFLLNRLTHCDFILFNKLDKTPRLVVEVDGIQHKKKIQKTRDERKDRILQLAGIPIIRITTTSSKCKERIEEALRKAD